MPFPLIPVLVGAAASAIGRHLAVRKGKQDQEHAESRLAACSESLTSVEARFSSTRRRFYNWCKKLHSDNSLQLSDVRKNDSPLGEVTTEEVPAWIVEEVQKNRIHIRKMPPPPPLEPPPLNRPLTPEELSLIRGSQVANKTGHPQLAQLAAAAALVKVAGSWLYGGVKFGWDSAQYRSNVELYAAEAERCAEEFEASYKAEIKDQRDRIKAIAEVYQRCLTSYNRDTEDGSLLSAIYVYQAMQADLKNLQLRWGNEQR